MATRLSYALPVARILARDTFARATGRLAASVPRAGEPWLAVTGTGRSGTSAVARVLHESGISMGTEFDAPSEHNTLGFYEDVHALRVNQAVMADLGAVDLVLAERPPSRALVLAAGERHAGEMRRVAATGARGWKDPLFCFTLESWMRALRRRARVIVCLRGPEAFLHSAIAIYGLIDRDIVEYAWQQRLLRLLAVIAEYELDALAIEYDQLAADPSGTVARLAAFAGQELDAGQVDPSLRSHVYRVPKRHRALYARVAALGNPGYVPPAVRANEASPAELEAYAAAVAEIEHQVAGAKRAWESAVDIDSAAALRDGALAASRSAGAAYDAALEAARSRLMALDPPDELEEHHDLLRAAVDRERLAEVLTVRACDTDAPDRDLLARAQALWREHGAPGPWAKAAGARERELARALRAVP